MKHSAALVVGAVLVAGGVQASERLERTIAAQVDALHAPVVLSERAKDGRIETRIARPTGRDDGDVHDAFRIASVTKTYVAATVLRLVEQGKLSLSDPLAAHLDPALAALLAKDGYALDQITIAHALSHTAGFNDHAQNPNFIEVWQADPATHWERVDHVAKLVEWTDRLAGPGEQFAYSDSGYVLLGDVVERVSGKPLAAAVRESLGFDRLGLANTWWEQAEPPRGPRAHQWLDGTDTYAWDASLDLYGGGGLVATVPDMARFFAALLSGAVFEHRETLDRMLSGEGLVAGSPYRLGIFAYESDGRATYGHPGFWGTVAVHDPESGVTFAAAAYDRADYPKLKEIAQSYFR